VFGSKPSFPVERSLLSAPALLAEAVKRYDLAPSTTCELLHPGLNDHYSMTSGDQRFVLRVYRAGWRSEEQILFELTLLAHLKKQGAPVAAPVRTRSGNWFCIVRAPEGPRHVVLFEHAAGKPKRWTDFTPEVARSYGKGLAVLHDGMRSFHATHQRFDLDLFHLVREPLRALAPRFAHRPDDLAYLEKLGERLREVIVALDNKGLTRSLCHGDLHGGNAHFEGQGSVTFFDFDCCGPGWLAYDLAVFRWAVLMSEQVNGIDLWEAFLSGYRAQREIEAIDMSAVPAFVAARELWFMGLQAATGPDHGIAYLDDAYYDRSMKLLRDWDRVWL
jgi:Ser/Thr protein kinase RdoA (MazF antagonist)